MAAAKKASGNKKLARGSQSLDRTAQFQAYWRQWNAKEGGKKVALFHSSEPIGVGHYKLWKFLMAERRLWRRYLHSLYGFNVHSGKFTRCTRSNSTQPVPLLEEAIEGEVGTDVMKRLSRRRQCLRHPFYLALEQYLVACDCLERCGDPPELLSNPHFVLHAERSMMLPIADVYYSKRILLNEMEQAEAIPGETYGEFLKRPQKSFRSRNMQLAFDSVYMPLVRILALESEQVADTDEFYGAFADTGISLRKSVRLRAALALGGADPYKMKQQLLPPVVLNVILPKLLEISDLNGREAAFRKLPGKAAYALEVTLEATKKTKRPSIVQLNEETVSNNDSLEERVAREQVNEEALARLPGPGGDQGEVAKNIMTQLTSRQREVYILHEVHGLTLNEIAQRLKIAPGTVASHYARAKDTIREMQKK